MHTLKLHYIGVGVLQTTEKDAFIMELALDGVPLLNTYFFLLVTMSWCCFAIHGTRTIYLDEVD